MNPATRKPRTIAVVRISSVLSSLSSALSAIMWSSEQKKHIVTGVEVHFEYLFSLFFSPLLFLLVYLHDEWILFNKRKIRTRLDLLSIPKSRGKNVKTLSKVGS